MCGIAGLMAIGVRGREADPAAMALRMADTLAHRGPDGRDAWGDAEAGIGLGHRRLSIIDLSPTGAQPMHSADGRYVISYNGEVYNFRELRQQLEAKGHRFRGTSDTEVMLAAFVEWGIDAAVARFVGMFAFALFDRQTRTLYLVRDRLGVKPLYWTVADERLLFGSELRALMAHPAVRKEVDRAAIGAVLRYSYVPAPATVFRNVRKLPPGSILRVRAGEQPSVTPYWRFVDVIHNGTVPIDAHEAAERLDVLLRDAVSRRMIADVPLGAFLSGGIDSSTVIGLMQSVSNRPIRTFTIGFRDATYDEAQHAREVARHLGTDHTEVELAPDAALDFVENVADWFDEPFADASQLPTYLVARTTRQHVTVALSGDGGDELFGGYPKYDMISRLWRRVGGLPQGLRVALASVLAHIPEPALRIGAACLMDAGRAERIGEKKRRLSAALQASDADRAALAIACVGTDHELLLNGAGGTLRLEPLAGFERLDDLALRMQAYDSITYLPDDILTKVDRCSMAVSLEARGPLLDHRLVEFVWSLPPTIRRGDGRPKALLRAVLDRYVPRALTERPKRGFSVPLAAWLSGPLRAWAEDLLSAPSLTADGLFDAQRVRTFWQRHLDGREQNPTALWNLLMVRAWSKRWLA